MASFIFAHAGVHPSADLRCIGWAEDDKLVIVAAFNGFVGKLAQIHIAAAPGWHFAPRSMLQIVFDYAFNQAGLEMLIGVVNSQNERAMRLDLHLGFKEILRLPGMHTDGGDLVVLAMKKSECKYLDKPDDAGRVKEVGHA